MVKYEPKLLKLPIFGQIRPIFDQIRPIFDGIINIRSILIDLLIDFISKKLNLIKNRSILDRI